MFYSCSWNGDFPFNGGCGAAYLLITGNGPLALISNNMINGMSNTSLLAIHFLYWQGSWWMLRHDHSRFEVCPIFYRQNQRWPGYACVFINVIYAGVSGSAPADCSAISQFYCQPWRRKDIWRFFRSSECNSSSRRSNYPPSIPMVFLALITNLLLAVCFWVDLFQDYWWLLPCALSSF